MPAPGQPDYRGLLTNYGAEVAVGYTHLFSSNQVLDARVGLSRTKAGKFSTSIGSTSFNIPGLPTTNAVVAGPTYTVSATASSGLAVVFSSKTPTICAVTGPSGSGKSTLSLAAMRRGLPQKSCFFTVLRQAMAGDDRDPAGIYFGTNSGSVFGSIDEGETWQEIARHLPTILAVEVLERMS